MEKRTTIQSLQTHIFGTALEYVKRWKLEPYILVNDCGFGFYTTERQIFRKMQKPFCVVDMNPWAASRDLRCTVKTGVAVTDLKRENGKIVLTDSEQNSYIGTIVVDCSGDAQIVGSLLGIKKSACDFIDVSVVFDNVKVDRLHEMSYYQDARLTNCGGWYHPLSPTSALLGMSEWTGEAHLNKDELRKRFESYLNDFPPFKQYFKDATIREISEKIGPTTQLHTSITEDNYLSVGDAAGAGTPFIGLGFYTALAMADSAFEAIMNAHKEQDYSKKSFRLHEQKFQQEFGRWYKWSTLLRWIYMKYTTNAELNVMADVLPDYSDEEYYAILLSYITPRMMLKLFLKRFVWLRILKNALIYHILRPIGIASVAKRPLKTPDPAKYRIQWPEENKA